MLKKLVIKNFQSHPNTSLDLSSHVNVITGKSQAGKSAILRALYWLIDNRPSGLRFKSHFAKDDSVKVMAQLDDGTQIWHIKDEKTHEYVHGKKVYEKVGKNVPDKVTEALNFSELNIQQQLDKPFMITSSAGEIAKTINRITRLEKVDEWTSALTTKVNSLNKDANRINNEVSIMNDKLERFKELDAVGDMLEDVKNKERLHNQKETQLRAVISGITQVTHINLELKKFANVKHVEAKIKKAEEMEVKITKMNNQLISTITLGKLSDQLTGLIKKETKFDLVLELIKKSEALITQLELIVKLIELNIDVAAAESRLHDLKTIYIETLLKESACPICFQKISKALIEKIARDI